MRKNLDILLTIIVTLTLTVAMLWPLEAPPPAPEGSDKLVHFVAFAALAFPLARTGRFGLMPVFIGASAYGGIIEIIQPSFNRSADVNDWIADVVGVVLGIGCGLLYRRLRNCQTQRRLAPWVIRVWLLVGVLSIIKDQVEPNIN